VVAKTRLSACYSSYLRNGGRYDLRYYWIRLLQRSTALVDLEVPVTSASCATVERTFSSMKHIKTYVQSTMVVSLPALPWWTYAGLFLWQLKTRLIISLRRRGAWSLFCIEMLT